MPNNKRNKRPQNRNFQNNNNNGNGHHFQQSQHKSYGINKQHSHRRGGIDSRRIYIAPHLINDALDENLEQTDINENQPGRPSKKDKKFFKKFDNLVVEKNRPKKLAIGEDDKEQQKQLPPIQPHCQLKGVPDDVFKVIVKFLQDYFTCYDANRDGLLAAYNPKCLFSMSINSTNSNAYRTYKFDEYSIRESRNLKRIFASDEYYQDKRFKLLHEGHIDTINVLRKLPPSEHIPESFKLDHIFFTPHMISFSVVGTFKEGKPTDKVRPIRSFERVWVCIPDPTTAMSIINEQYVIANITNMHYKNYYKDKERPPQSAKAPVQQQQTTSNIILPVNDPSINLLPTNLNDLQKQQILKFSLESKLNLKWSHDCLEQSGWNFEAAAQMFVQYKDKIPQDAYLPL